RSTPVTTSSLTFSSANRRSMASPRKVLAGAQLGQQRALPRRVRLHLRAKPPGLLSPRLEVGVHFPLVLAVEDGDDFHVGGFQGGVGPRDLLGARPALQLAYHHVEQYLGIADADYPGSIDPERQREGWDAHGALRKGFARLHHLSDRHSRMRVRCAGRSAGG